MKTKASAITALLTVAGIFLAAAPAFAVDCSVKCPKRAMNERAIKNALEEEILQQFSPDISNPKARVKMRVLSVTPAEYFITSGEILSGLTITNNGFPNELSFGVDGTNSFGVSELCQYDYKVTIKTKGFDTIQGVQLNAQSESFITVFSSFGRTRVICQ